MVYLETTPCKKFCTMISLAWIATFSLFLPMFRFQKKPLQIHTADSYYFYQSPAEPFMQEFKGAGVLKFFQHNTIRNSSYLYPLCFVFFFCFFSFCCSLHIVPYIFFFSFFWVSATRKKKLGMKTWLNIMHYWGIVIMNLSN